MKVFQGKGEGTTNEGSAIYPSGSAVPALRFEEWASRDFGSVRLYVCVVRHDCCALLVVVAIWEGQAPRALFPCLQQVGSGFIVVGEGQGVIIQPWQAVWVNLQIGPLVIRKGHGEESLGVAHKLVHIPLTCHLRNQTKDIFDSLMNPHPYLNKVSCTLETFDLLMSL